MAKIYTDEEIEQLSKHPYVSNVSRHQLSLTLEFKQLLYEEWLKAPLASTVKKMLENNGFDTKSLGADFYKNLSKVFRDYGKPARSIVFKGGRFSEQSSGATAQDNASLPEHCCNEAEKGIPSDTHLELIQSGKFTASENGISFTPEFEKTLFEFYPETSIKEGLKKAGIRPEALGRGAVSRLKTTFDKALRMETSLDQSRRSDEPIPKEARKELRKNPFISSVYEWKIHFTPRFYGCAALLRTLPVDEVLDIFMVGHKWLTIKEKAALVNRLNGTDPIPAEQGFPGRTVFDAVVLRNRECALRKIARTGFSMISGKASSLPNHRKKELCLWMSSLPKDPSREFTIRWFLHLAGISKTSYYQYIGNDTYGKGMLRKQNEDARDAELVRMVFEYKEFRKGSRQVCMLLPRLTGRRMGLKKVRRLMKTAGLWTGIRETDEARCNARMRSEESVKPNLLKRRFRLYRPNRIRVTDVTYLDYGEGCRAYGSALMDPVTGRLLAFVVSDRNDLDMAIETLREADSHPCEDGGIFHSDQGILYRSGTFQKELLDRGLNQSMSKKGNCWDNATQESFFGHFKDECPYSSCKDLGELQKKVAEYADYYNNERGMWDRQRMTPVEYENYLASLDEDEFQKYLALEEEHYEKMKERAAELAKKRYGTLGV